jgi:outer membrane lipoprotein-sorting protein
MLPLAEEETSGLSLSSYTTMYRHMFRISALLLMLSFSWSLHAQTNQYLSRADSDPQAITLLDKLQEQLAKELLAMDFELTLQLPEEDPILQKGKYQQQGKMYRISTNLIEIWSDGVTRWVLDKEAKEVSVYSEKATGEQLSPTAMFLEITGDQYIAVVSGSAEMKGGTAHIIELKPTDRNSDVSKLRVTLYSDGKPAKLEIMEKSSARTTLVISAMRTPEKTTASYFTFSKGDYPGVHIEDLRID